ncbi:MAG: hypothetical protein K8T10_17155 [Candidatus Eremiobacteraeota bacterium]|nr:hypothetical protein [Candidatus Eremiobacteraeota bacterium]
MRINRREIKREINRLADEVRDETGVELIRTEYVREGGRRILRVIIDRQGGVSLSDCETFSRALSEKLDEEGLLEERYCLEVSSPGIDSKIPE